MYAQDHLEDFADRIQPRAAANLLLWIVGATFALLLIWASLTVLDRSVHASGRVSPSARLQTVSNLEGGVVQAIMVRTGQIVPEGAPLVRLDQTQTGAEYGSGQAALDALTLKVARLEAEVEGRAPVWPQIPHGEGALAVEKALYASRVAERAGLFASAKARVAQAQQALTESQAAFAGRNAMREAAQSEAAMLRPLVAKGIEPQLSLVRAQGQASAAAADAAAAEAAIAKARSALAEAQSARIQAEQQWRSQAGDELAAARAEREARSKSLPALADRVKRTIIRSPMAGRVNRVLVTTVGGTVRPGEPLVEIVPDRDALVIEALVNPKDIAFVSLGQRAKIGLTAYDSAVYGRMDGEVIAISPDATANERTGESFYTIKVRTHGTSLADPAGHRLPIGPGMIADVSLLGNRRSVLSYLLTPITRLSETAFRE